ncbi:MAG: hypothetical protein J2P30_00490 [Actinobacteria bacterium]|nr:hypothetical protein [Actinomycetota bacterium]
MSPAASEGAPVSEWLLTWEGRAWLDNQCYGGSRFSNGLWVMLKRDDLCAGMTAPASGATPPERV